MPIWYEQIWNWIHHNLVCINIILIALFFLLLLLWINISKLKKTQFWTLFVIYIILRTVNFNSTINWWGLYLLDLWWINNLFLIFVNFTEKNNVKKITYKSKNDKKNNSENKDFKIENNSDYYIYAGNGSGKTTNIVSKKEIWNKSFYYDCTFSNKLEKLIMIKNDKFEVFNVLSVLNLWFINNYYKYVIIDDFYLAIESEKNEIEHVYNLISMSKSYKIVINKYSQMEMMRMCNDLSDKKTNFIEKISLKYDEVELPRNEDNENHTFMKHIFSKYNVNRRYQTNDTKINIVDLKTLVTHAKNNIYGEKFFIDESKTLIKSLIQKMYDDFKKYDLNLNKHIEYEYKSLKDMIKEKYQMDLNDLAQKIIDQSKLYPEVLYLHLYLITIIIERNIMNNHQPLACSIVDSDTFIKNTYEKIFIHHFVIEEDKRMLNRKNDFKKEKTNKEYQNEILTSIYNLIKNKNLIGGIIEKSETEDWEAINKYIKQNLFVEIKELIDEKSYNSLFWIADEIQFNAENILNGKNVKFYDNNNVPSNFLKNEVIFNKENFITNDNVWIDDIKWVKKSYTSWYYQYEVSMSYNKKFDDFLNAKKRTITLEITELLEIFTLYYLIKNNYKNFLGIKKNEKNFTEYPIEKWILAQNPEIWAGTLRNEILKKYQNDWLDFKNNVMSTAYKYPELKLENKNFYQVTWEDVSDIIERLNKLRKEGKEITKIELKELIESIPEEIKEKIDKFNNEIDSNYSIVKSSN